MTHKATPTRVVGDLVVGDWNLSRDAMGDLVDAMGAELVVGTAVDHGIVAGATVLESVTRNLPQGGSDHRPLLVEVSVAGERVRVLWWNVYVGQHPDDVLTQLLHLTAIARPHVIALGEAYRCRKVLGRVPGYRRHQSRRGEPSELAVLTLRSLTVLSSRRLRMRQRWIGPKHDLPHGPKAYPHLRLRLRRGVVLRFLAVHLPTGGHTGRNGAAVQESTDRIARWSR